VGERLVLEPGQRWRQYQLGDVIPGGPGKCFAAVDASELQDVILRVIPVAESTDGRAGAWAALEEMKEPWLVGSLKEAEEDGFRFEVSEVPPAMNLREWLSCRQAGEADVEALVRQLAAALGKLHGAGIVHLNLQPETVHVKSAEGTLQVQLGGLELATFFEQPQPLRIPVNPYYAPPEAAGLADQPPGRGLCAWDWWTLGRLVQEMILGRHVLSLLVARDVNKAREEMRPMAETLLLETGKFAERAGAVEAMSDLSSSSMALLRGLLASARDGRWGLREVERWLARQPVAEHYDHPKGRRFFKRQGEVLSMPEAAEFFSREENWAEGEANLFNADDPATLGGFIASEPGYEEHFQRLKDAFDLGGIPEWRGLKPTAPRSALAGLAWALLGGGGKEFRVRGKVLSGDTLLGLMKGSDDGPDLIKVLIVPLYLQHLERVDAAAARLLREVTEVHAAVMARAAEKRWVEALDPEAPNVMMALVLQPPGLCAEAHRRLRKKFACARDPLVDGWFKESYLDRPSQVLIAYAERHPDQFGFVSREEWNTGRYRQLAQRGERMGATLFWLRLRLALATNPVSLGPWWLFALCWGLAAGAAATIGRGPEGLGLRLGIPLLLLPVALRAGVWSRLGGQVSKWLPSARPWRRSDGGGRCRAEIAELWRGEAAPESRELRRQLAEVNRDIGEIELVPAPKPVRCHSHFWGIWIVSGGCWLVLAAVIAATTRAGVMRFREISQQPGQSIAEAMFFNPAGPDRAPEESAPAGPDWSLVSQAGPKIPWNLKTPKEVPPLKVLMAPRATADQVAYALVEGERLLVPYQRMTIPNAIAVLVPTKRDFGLVLFNGRDGFVDGRRIYVVRELPKPGTWFELGGRRVVYLGTTR